MVHADLRQLLLAAPLAALYAAHKELPAVREKRRLWARLLETALGTRFEDSDDLFVEHTLLVLIADVIAHAVLGLAPQTVVPRSVAAGEKLDEAGVPGVVEADFFDWVADVPGGGPFIRTLATRTARLDWGAADHDMLKVLYESVVCPEVRKRLGEYYTPDWLAEKIVETVITDPLRQQVLDPACGSGTFLFHAVRRYLGAAEQAGMDLRSVLDGVTAQVRGMDLHPVTVRLARVTYLLALGKERLVAPERDRIRVPVFLRDSLQWRRESPALFSTSELYSPVDVLIGNPPWLAFRHMSESMQRDFREMSEARGLWQGAKVATQQDLSALFVVRAVERYLKQGGSFGFVMPSAALDRKQFAGFREGLHDDSDQLRIAFGKPWDLRRLRPHFFPITASVVFGKRSPTALAMPPDGEVWTGRLPDGAEPWQRVSAVIRRSSVQRAELKEPSPYRERFRNGATIVPRVLFMIEQRSAAPLGQVASRASVRSARSANEKMPWKDLMALEGVIESEFIYPVHLGETVLPYRHLEPLRALLPITSKGVLHVDEERVLLRPGLADWWTRAVAIWEKHRSSDRLSLPQQLDYHGKLTGQFPLPPLRLVYTKSGMHLAAAVIDDHRAVIDHTLYWAALSSRAEGDYLCAILNSAAVTRLVRPLMSFGKDERHIDKYVWALSIPMFDPNNAMHACIATLGQQAARAIAGLALDDTKHFSAMRRTVREWLEESKIGHEIEEKVEKLLV